MEALLKDEWLQVDVKHAELSTSLTGTLLNSPSVMEVQHSAQCIILMQHTYQLAGTSGQIAQLLLQ